MKYLLWDFDNTLAYRDGMWSSTIYDLLIENGYNHFSLEDIKPYLASGFPWHCSEVPHKDFFRDKQWWEYMNEHFSNILQKLEFEKAIADKISENIKLKYLDLKKWYLYDDTIYCLKLTLEKGYKNIIISNHVPELEGLVTGLGIRDYFENVYSSADLGYEKPNVNIFKKVIMKLKEKESITMI